MTFPHYPTIESDEFSLTPQGVIINTRPAHGTPEFNAIYDAHRKLLGYPSREQIAVLDRRFPTVNAKATGADQ